MKSLVIVLTSVLVIITPCVAQDLEVHDKITILGGTLSGLLLEKNDELGSAHSFFWQDFDGLNIGSFEGYIKLSPAEEVGRTAATKMIITNIGAGIALGQDALPNETLEVGGDGRAFFGDGEQANRKGLLIDGTYGASATRLESYDYGNNIGLDLVLNSAGGQVGIGNIDPSHILHINGVGRSTSSTWATSSDRRVKQNIRPLTQALSKIISLNPVIFDWKQEYMDHNPSLTQNKYGFIAQEAKEVIPQMVTEVVESYGDQTITDFNVLSTDVLFPIMVKALQEQQKIINDQNHEINNQKVLIDEILQRLAQLENKS